MKTFVEFDQIFHISISDTPVTLNTGLENQLSHLSGGHSVPNC